MRTVIWKIEQISYHNQRADQTLARRQLLIADFNQILQLQIFVGL